MKYVLAVCLSVGFLFSVCHAAEKSAMKAQKDKESYSLGYRFGQNLKYQRLDINLEVYTSGIRDALAGTDPQLSQEEMQKTVLEVQKRVVAARQKELKEMGEKNLAAGKAFMEENKKKEGIKTLPSGLQYKVLVEGSGKKPNANGSVTVNYRGTFINGTRNGGSHSRTTGVSYAISNNEGVR